MSRYNQYGNYYDPVGSQANQPTGYTYRGSASHSAYANPPTSTGHTSSNYQSYGTQQYGSTAQPSNSSTTHAAAALSALSGSNYNQTPAANTASSSSRYDNSNWSSAGANSTAYSTTPLSAVPNRNQSNNSPLYASTQSSNTYGRRSAAEQSQSSMSTYGNSQMTYQNAPSSAGVGGSSYHSAHSQQPAQPPRYSSPLHAVQPQQQTQQNWRTTNQTQSPQLSNASQTQHNRQQSASVEPSTTVDPSQVYDNRAELQRKAQIEAEKRKKFEAEQAARKAEEDRIAEETRKQEAAKKAEEDAAKKAEAQKRKNEQKKKAREEKKQNKDAATVLQRMSSGTANESAGPAANPEEEEMRAMFQKMREFNAKNPAMLAKLWDEERKSHESTKTTPTPGQQKAVKATSPTGVRPFAKPSAPAKSSKAGSETKQKTPQQAVPQQANSQPPGPFPGQANTTSLWPPHKKGALAEVTANWLISLPPNEGKSILAKNVLDILDQNPSYVQLCEALEGYGMAFDRSTLARELLKAVPDGLKAQGAPKASTPLGGLSGAAAQSLGASTGSPSVLKGKGKQRKDDSLTGSRTSTTVNYEAPISLSAVARELNTTGRQSVPPMMSQASPPQMSQSPYFASAAPFTNGSRPASQAGASETKPEQKPEPPPRPPADKEEAARKRTFGDLVDLTAEDSDDEGPPPKRIMMPPAVPAPGLPPQGRDPLAYIAQPVSFKQFMYGPRQDGQVKSMHGPPGFNVQTQKGMTSMAGQSTKQANGVPSPYGSQPKQPVASVQQAAPPRPKGPAPEHLQLARIKGKMLVEPIMRDRVTRKSKYDSRTIARDVLLATGRHPDMRALNAHLLVMQKLLGQHGVDSEGGNKSDLATIRWDAIDPDQPKGDKKEESLAPKKDDEAEYERERDNVPKPRTAQISITRPASPPALPPKKKKPGRPRKSENITSTNAGLTNPELDNPESQTRRSLPATPSLPHPVEMAASGAPATGYSAFQQIDPLTGKKKKGRPFGWKKSVHSREAQGLTPAVSHTKPKASPAVLHAEPEYQVYRCEWQGCKSELHNLDTLKKHLVKVHGKRNEEGGWECRWKGCELAEGELGGIEGWLGHVDEVHLGPVRWRLGDGPVVGGEFDIA